MNCPRCRNFIYDNDSFCESCGFQLEKLVHDENSTEISKPIIGDYTVFDKKVMNNSLSKFHFDTSILDRTIIFLFVAFLIDINSLGINSILFDLYGLSFLIGIFPFGLICLFDLVQIFFFNIVFNKNVKNHSKFAYNLFITVPIFHLFILLLFLIWLNTNKIFSILFVDFLFAGLIIGSFHLYLRFNNDSPNRVLIDIIKTYTKSFFIFLISLSLFGVISNIILSKSLKYPNIKLNTYMILVLVITSIFTIYTEIVNKKSIKPNSIRFSFF